jgi:hypothetical protein
MGGYGFGVIDPFSDHNIRFFESRANGYLLLTYDYNTGEFRAGSTAKEKRELWPYEAISVERLQEIFESMCAGWDVAPVDVAEMVCLFQYARQLEGYFGTHYCAELVAMEHLSHDQRCDMMRARVPLEDFKLFTETGSFGMAIELYAAAFAN